MMLRGEKEVEVELSLLATEMRKNTIRLHKMHFPWHIMGCKDMLESRLAKVAFAKREITGLGLFKFRYGLQNFKYLYRPLEIYIYATWVTLSYKLSFILRRMPSKVMRLQGILLEPLHLVQSIVLEHEFKQLHFYI